MNIYGDYGNIICLRKRLQWRGLDCEVAEVEAGEALPKNFDMIFIGGGQDRGQIRVAEDLQHKKHQLVEAVEDGLPALAICGGYQLFGDYFLSSDYGQLPGIGVFPVVTKATQTRMIGNVVLQSQAFGTLVGFENHSGATELYDNARPLGKVNKGYGNDPTKKFEGVIYNNGIGTYLHGSFLPKNPQVADHLLQIAATRRSNDLELSPLDDSLAKKAALIAQKRPQ
ncbi:glutamine amidotransferase [Candidatus Saccharibacteria bacterium]|nr:glutamine amidotransferase [Candidatus Saccharibacteria bacterium]